MRNKRNLLIALIIIIIPIIGSFPVLAKYLSKEIGYEFRVEGELWFIVDDKEGLEKILSEYKNQYLEGIDENAKIKNIEFKQKVEIIEVEVYPEDFSSLIQAKEKIYAKEKEATYIEVQKGDNLWNLAKKHGISLAELEILNPDIDPERIYPGDKLVIDPFKPVLDVVIELENTVIETIPFNTEYQKDTSLYKSQKKVIKEGIEGEKEVTYHIELVNGFQSKIEVAEEKVIKEPVTAVVKIGTKTTVSRGGSVNYGVVQGKRVTSNFGYRIHPITGRRSFHSGVDIAAKHGTAVYAYSDGKVVEAGWNGAYGLNVVIDHGSGLKTRYAHLSKIYVKVGQRVTTAQRIGAVGSTGRSTGSHLHFEVIVNGTPRNPWNYI